MTAKQALYKEIAALRKKVEGIEKQIVAHQAALRVLQKAEAEGAPELRFYMWRPLDAMRLLLKENGAMKRPDLETLLVQGGITLDRKRKEANVRLSIEKNLAIGNLVALEDGLIDLPSNLKQKNLVGI